jgi:hypothetical protein
VSDKQTYPLNNTSFCCSVFLKVVITGERWVTIWPTCSITRHSAVLSFSLLSLLGKVSDKLTYPLNNTSFCCSVFLKIVITGERWVTIWPTCSITRHSAVLSFLLSSLLGKGEWQADLPAQQYVILLFYLSHCPHCWRNVSDKLTYPLNNMSFCCYVFLTVIIAGERWVTSWLTRSTIRHSAVLSFSLSSLLGKGEWQGDLPAQQYVILLFCLSHCRRSWGKVSNKLTYPLNNTSFCCSVLWKGEWQADLSHSATCYPAVLFS